MSVSYIPEKIKILLWGKAGGRCEYRGCNDCLYRDDLTKAEFNQSYIAHIIADKPEGPRGDSIKSELLKCDISNLMLMCDVHHRLIDKVNVSGHTVELLTSMKMEHETRIEKVTDINQNMHSHILIYKANVGVHSPVLTYDSVKEFLLPTHYPASNTALDLSLSNSSQRDKDKLFWETEIDNLVTQFNEQVRPKFRKGEISHLSVFGFAPQPLLIKLGTLLSDIQNAEIHQPIRDPKTWRWQENGEDISYNIIEPDKKFSVVALNISLSGDIENVRIKNILGDDCSIYTLRIEKPFNDFMKNKKYLQEFSIEMRKLFNQIKMNYSAQTNLHIFPAMPVSAAIELGRIWMSKADMPLIIYDENTTRGGFIKALEIKNI